MLFNDSVKVEMPSVRPSTTNPMAVNDAEHDGQQNEQQQEEEEEHEEDTESNSQLQIGSCDDLLSKYPSVEFTLRFAGVPPVPTWWSPWTLTRVFWPVTLALSALATIYYIVLDFQYGSFAEAYTVSIPLFFGNVSALSCYWWLWPMAEKLLSREAPLPPLQLKDAVRRAAVFVSIWLIAGLVQFLYQTMSADSDSTFLAFGVIPGYSYTWMTFVSSSPVLGAFLLVMSMESSHATNAISELLDAAERKTLTREIYTSARDRIFICSSRWNRPLGALTLSALYNTIGLLVILHNPQFDTYFTSVVEADLVNVVFLGKEVMLLFYILTLVMKVNDLADAMISVLGSERWGDLGSKEENVRLDLLFLTTCKSVTRRGAGSMWRRVTVPKSLPVSFKVCGLRATGELVVASFISVVFSILSAILKREV